jgi:hypothetical protein
MKMTLDSDVAAEAKALVALAFRNGPIEDIHAGRPCEICNGRPEFSHISDHEMKTSRSAVDALYRLLWEREYDQATYRDRLNIGRRYTQRWDDPELREPGNTGFLDHRQLPESGGNGDRRRCDFARARTSITVRLV